MADVFLSYDREDVGHAHLIANALEQAGHFVWWDRHIKGGAQFAKEIEEALTRAGAVVVLWSKHSVESAWVRDEATAGRDSGRLVPVALEGMEPPLGFRQYHTIDLSGAGRRRRAQLRELVGAVDAVAERAGSGSDRRRSTTAHARRVGRRELVIGGAAAGITAVGGAGWLWLREDRLTGEARKLVDEAREALNENEIDRLSSAASRLRRAAQLAPESAEVWGLLALVYERHARLAPGGERSALAARGLAAARRALALDPNQPDARAATILAMPRYRNWLAYEKALRDALRGHPKHPELNVLLSVLLTEVGRFGEALELLETAMKRRAMSPQLHSQRIIALMTLRRLDEAESALDKAVGLWPRHYSIWFTRLFYLQYNGRAREALAMVEDTSNRPIGIPDWNFDLSAVQANAIASGDSRVIRQALSAWEKAASRGTGFAASAAHFAAFVGDSDMAFRMLDALYFNRGLTMADVRYSKEQGRYSGKERQTSNLFLPGFARLRRDPRFAALIREIGLDDYWKRTGTRGRVFF